MLLKLEVFFFTFADVAKVSLFVLRLFFFLRFRSTRSSFSRLKVRDFSDDHVSGEDLLEFSGSYYPYLVECSIGILWLSEQIEAVAGRRI